MFEEAPNTEGEWIMASVITPTSAPGVEQRAEDIRSVRPAIQRIRQRQHMRQAGTPLGQLYDFCEEPSRLKTDQASRLHDRASMLLVAEVRSAGAPVRKAVVRNISAAGLMVEMDQVLTRGDFVSLNLGNLGWTDGTVVWKVGRRFGVRFDQAIDPASVRRTIGAVPRVYERSLPRRGV